MKKTKYYALIACAALTARPLSARPIAKNLDLGAQSLAIPASGLGSVAAERPSLAPLLILGAPQPVPAAVSAADPAAAYPALRAAQGIGKPASFAETTAALNRLFTGSRLRSTGVAGSAPSAAGFSGGKDGSGPPPAGSGDGGSGRDFSSFIPERITALPRPGRTLVLRGRLNDSFSAAISFEKKPTGMNRGRFSATIYAPGRYRSEKTSLSPDELSALGQAVEAFIKTRPNLRERALYDELLTGIADYLSEKLRELAVNPMRRGKKTGR